MPRSTFARTRRAPLAAAIAVAAALAAASPGPTTAAPARPDGAAAVTASVTLYPVADAYVDASSPATNHDTAAEWPLELKANGREHYPLWRFDTSAIPEGAQVTAADLKVYVVSGEGDSPIHIIVERITLTWDQATVTWNNRPPTQGTWGSWDTDTDPGTRTFDIRVLVGNWVRASMPNHGLTLRGPATGVYERLFRATGANRPHIDVTYIAPTATPTASPTATTLATASPSSTATPTSTLTTAPTATGTSSATPTPSATATQAPSATPTDTALPPGSETPTVAPSLTPSATAPTPATVTATATLTPTLTLTPTATVVTPGPSPTSGASPTSGPSPSPTAAPGTTTVTPPPIVPSPTPTTPTGVPFARVYLPLALRAAPIEAPSP